MFTRYAIFFTPTGPLAAAGSAWLGWDAATGRAVAHPAIPEIDVSAITCTPRKYGLHATLKAPFFLAEGQDAAQLEQAVADFANSRKGCEIGALDLRYDHGFVALRPRGPVPELQGLAADIVRHFDHFRAPLTTADIARRRRARLTERQDGQLLAWGYPFVFDDFQFHITLSGALSEDTAPAVMEAAAAHLAGLAGAPLRIDALTLAGQDAGGMFHHIGRFALAGTG